jgi:glycosyltransferase involved in cell wall biosynthesis
MNPLITIITVTLNNKNGLKKTLDSISKQKYKNIELIIVDGKSEDGTEEYIKTNKNLIENKLKRFLYIYEKDEGIYDAMNKGIKASTGDWIIFMNAGDTFFDEGVISKIFEDDSIFKEADIIYGKTNLIANEKLEMISKPKRLDDINYGMIFAHQSVFVRAHLLKDNLFANNYKICADYDFLLHMYQQKRKFKEIDLIISNFEETGVSTKNKLKSYRETKEISLKYASKKKQEIKIHIVFYINVLKFIIRKLSSPSFIYKLRKLKNSIYSKMNKSNA